MPSRAYTSFLPKLDLALNSSSHLGVNALSGLYLISTTKNSFVYTHINDVSMPSRAYTSFLLHLYQPERVCNAFYVSMPSRAYTSFLRELDGKLDELDTNVCQCPLGLIPHFYGTPSKT